METIGQRLRQARERLGLSLEEAERTTRIRAQHLSALERDDFHALPSPVQARGFLKNYADYLGLDTDRLLQDYGAAPSTRRPPAARPTTAPRAEVRVRRRGWFSADLLVAAAIALGTLTLLVWGGGRLMASLRAAATPAGQSSALLIPTATETQTATAPPPASGQPIAAFEAPTATATLPPLDLPVGGVSVRVLAVQRAWVRALADGQERYQGRVEPGAIIDLAGDRQIEVTTGNGAGLRLTLNGEDLGLMGGLDEALTRIWTTEGEITATPTVTPTPTTTPRPSATPFGAAPLGPTG
jgi:transcriptional regulator with XRE-family HTH domain